MNNQHYFLTKSLKTLSSDKDKTSQYTRALHEQTVDTPSKLQSQNVFEKIFLKGQFLVFRTP